VASETAPEVTRRVGEVLKVSKTSSQPVNPCDARARRVERVTEDTVKFGLNIQTPEGQQRQRGAVQVLPGETHGATTA